MKQDIPNPNPLIRKISKYVFLALMILFLLSVILDLSNLNKMIGLGFDWIQLPICLLFFVFTSTPGVMVWIKPSFSLMWLNFLNKRLFPIKPWDELHPEQKFLVYLNSTLALVAGLIAAYFLYEMVHGNYPLK